MKKRNSEHDDIGYDPVMERWEFPAVQEVDYENRIRELAAEGEPPVKIQHVVSRSVLKGFSKYRLGNEKYQLTPYDITRGEEMKVRGLRGCGKIDNFLSYASASAERVWKRVEDELPPAIAAARSRNMSGRHANVLLDCIALHYVRSMRYLRIHGESAQGAVSDVTQEMLTTKSLQLRRVFYRKYGLHAAGRDALASLLAEPVAKWLDHEKSGALARASIESMFERVRMTLAPRPLQIWHTPVGRELLISDSPAFTYAYDSGNRISLNRAIGDSNGIGLPIARDCHINTGNVSHTHMEMTPEDVDFFNGIQLEVAHRYVYYQPGSNLGRFVRSTMASRS